MGPGPLVCPPDPTLGLYLRGTTFTFPTKAITASTSAPQPATRNPLTQAFTVILFKTRNFTKLKNPPKCRMKIRSPVRCAVGACCLVTEEVCGQERPAPAQSKNVTDGGWKGAPPSYYIDTGHGVDCRRGKVNVYTITTMCQISSDPFYIASTYI